MKKSDLMSGALILSIGSVLAKIFSAVYRLALTSILGGVGIGLYQLIFPFYSLCVVLATAGLPMAISKVISRSEKNEIKVLKKCFMFVSMIALTLIAILLISAKGLAVLQGEKQLSICYFILAPTIILISVSSVLRGYFQGKHNFTPTAISNIVEQFVKMVVGLILSVSLISVGVFAAIIGAVIGIVVSEVLSLIVLLLYIKKEKFVKNNNGDIKIKDLAKDILPITLTNIVLPISSFVDSVLVVNLLSVNFNQKVSVFLYGLESGVVSSLVAIPTIFSFAIASVVLPNMAGSKNEFNRNNKFSLSIKMVILITLPFLCAFILIPNRLIDCLYHNRLNSYGIDGIKTASQLLAISGIGVVFLAINQVYSSSLQSVDERYVAIRNLTIAVVIKFVFQLLFMPSKALNIYAYSIANTLCYAIAMVLNHLEIRERFKFEIDYSFLVKLILSNLVMIFSLIIILSIKVSTLNTILAVLVSMSVYLFCLLFFNVFTKRDKAMFKYKL